VVQLFRTESEGVSPRTHPTPIEFIHGLHEERRGADTFDEDTFSCWCGDPVENQTRQRTAAGNLPPGQGGTGGRASSPAVPTMT